MFDLKRVVVNILETRCGVDDYFGFWYTRSNLKTMKKPITLDQHKKTKKEIEHANEVHKRSLRFNDRALGYVSDVLGSPWVVYAFTAIALVGLTQVRSLLELVEWFSQTFVQFVALAIIQGRSNLQSRKEEARTDMIVKISAENEKDVHLLLSHQDYQNQQIDRILKEIKALKTAKKSKTEEKTETAEEVKENPIN